MFNFALAIFLFLSPIIIFPLNGFVARLQWYQFGTFSGSVKLLQLQFFQYGAIFLFLSALFSKPKRKFDNKYFGLLFGVYLWSVILHPKTIESFFTVFAGFIIYYLVSVYADKKRMFLWIIFSVSVLNTIFAILQSVGVNLIYLPNSHIIGLMSFKTHLGIYQAIAIPIAYSLNPLLALIPLIGLILSESFTAMAAAIIGMIYFLKIKPKQMIIPFLIICILWVKFSLYDRFLVRWDVWKTTFGFVTENIYGYGAGAFVYVKDRIQYRVQFDTPYSLYFSTLYALGILGLTAIILFIKNSLSKNVFGGIAVACLVLAVVGLGCSFLNYARLAGTAVVLFALLEVEKKEENLC